MTNDRTALVLGATGGIGSAIAAALLDRGWTVRALARDAAKAAANWQRDKSPGWIAGDAMTGADVTAAAEGVSAIFHAVNPPGYQNWEKLVLPMMANTLAAARAVGARIILPGTIYNYDPARPPIIDATTPQEPETRKGKIRVAMERMLEDAAPEVRSLILRAGDFFGPGARSNWFSQAMVKPGHPVRCITALTSEGGHSWAYLPDLAESFALLMEQDEHLASFGRVQFAGFYDVTGHELTDAIDRVVGRDLPVRGFPWWLMRLLAPFGGFPAEVVEIKQYWRHPVRFDNSRLVALTGKEPHTPLDTAIEDTLASLGSLGRSSMPTALAA